jgi:hypothetical protein
VSLPFDGPHEDAIIECIRLASVPQLGRELARRVENYAETAKLAEDASGRACDLLGVAHAADMAHAASQRAGDLCLAVLGCLGPCEIERASYAHATAAKVSADRAARRYQVAARLAGRGANV